MNWEQVFWKINDTGDHGESYIMIPAIEAITKHHANPTKIKIHVTSEKEFKADKKCLIELGKMLNLNLSL